MTFIILVLLYFLPLNGASVPTDERDLLAQKIFFNECGSNTDRLLHWNNGEEFPSLGIGHFIWYPQGKQGPFTETFPQLLAFLRDNGIALPAWLSQQTSCPWMTKEQFFSPTSKEKRDLLQQLLLSTLHLQAEFIYQRFQEGTKRLLLSCQTPDQKEHIQTLLSRLESSPQGRFALIDYVHFKGEGIAEAERYNNKGWGLKQVLERMPKDPKDPVRAFIESATAVLTERAENSPSESRERQWLKGWINRVHRYNQ